MSDTASDAGSEKELDLSNVSLARCLRKLPTHRRQCYETHEQADAFKMVAKPPRPPSALTKRLCLHSPTCSPSSKQRQTS